MKKKLIIILITLASPFAYGQSKKMRPLSELINTQEPGWQLVNTWISEAKNKVEILPKDTKRADSALYQAQVTTRSPMGAVIYETGGILINNGWLRILGSGSARLDRSLMDWNKGKTYNNLGEQLPCLLIADDVIGGFFAINAGGLSQSEIGKVFYFAPDNLKWESIGLGYSDFLVFCFSGDLDKFYSGFQWTNWKEEVKSVDGNKGIMFYPFLFTAEGKDINKSSRKAVPIEELWGIYVKSNK